MVGSRARTWGRSHASPGEAEVVPTRSAAGSSPVEAEAARTPSAVAPMPRELVPRPGGEAGEVARLGPGEGAADEVPGLPLVGAVGSVRHSVGVGLSRPRGAVGPQG